MALLAALAEITPGTGVQLAAGHVDHGWRGRESRGDARFVEKFCGSQAIPFYLRQVTIDGRGRSREEAARAARYKALKDMARESGAELIVTAHTRDDAAQTLLLALARGRPLEGLAGIREQRRDGIWRPLLGFSRGDLLDFLRRRGISFRADASNENLSFDRNWIRKRAIPYLSRRFGPALPASLAASCEALARDREWLESLFEERVIPLITRRGPDVEMPAAELRNLPSAARRRAVLAMAAEVCVGGFLPTRKELLAIEEQVVGGRPFRFQAGRRVDFFCRGKKVCARKVVRTL